MIFPKNNQILNFELSSLYMANIGDDATEALKQLEKVEDL